MASSTLWLPPYSDSTLREPTACGTGQSQNALARRGRSQHDTMGMGQCAHTGLRLTLDTACVGQVDDIGDLARPGLTLEAMSRGSDQRMRLDRSGFARGILMRTKRVQVSDTGDRIRAGVSGSVMAGVHKARMAVRTSGRVHIQTRSNGVSLDIQAIRHRHCQVVQCNDGYGFFSTGPITQVVIRQGLKQRMLRIRRSASPA